MMCVRDRSGATLLHTIATIDPPGVKRILALLFKKGRRKALRVMNRDGNTVGDIMRMDSSSTAHRCTTARYLEAQQHSVLRHEPTTVGTWRKTNHSIIIIHSIITDLYQQY